MRADLGFRVQHAHAGRGEGLQALPHVSHLQAHMMDAACGAHAQAGGCLPCTANTIALGAYVPAGLRSRNLLMGDLSPSGCSSSILVFGSSTNTTVTPCSGTG